MNKFKSKLDEGNKYIAYLVIQKISSSHYGIRGIVLKLLNNYLFERKQMTKIKDTLTHVNGTVILYADDTVIIGKV